MKSMVIQTVRGSYHNLCPCCSQSFSSGKSNEMIPIFYSERHAKDEGWIVTKDKMFCPPDKEYAWICPDCAKKCKWTKAE